VSAVAGAARVGLKVDVDTDRGTRAGLPALLDELARAGVRASVYVSLGPDRSGRAVVRLLTDPAFRRKMVRTGAARMYGWRTAFYGTLLPAPDIGRRGAAALERAAADGHEVGLHAWDHRLWQDTLERRERPWIERWLDAGCSAFARLYGRPPAAFAAPAWLATDEAWRALAARGFDYVSVTRAAWPPFLPTVADETLPLLEIPTTLPTLDEELGRDGASASDYVDRLFARLAPGTVEVLTVHAETEGLAYRREFRALLEGLAARGVAVVRLDELARESRAAAVARPVGLGEIPGRAGRVAVAGGSAAGA
jgi:undecaprenyl phosphate-alpha-L-ara4FN deformylase